MTDATRRLSIIIPTYQERGFLESTLASALRNTNADDEILIVHNGSDQEYRVALERFVQPRVRLLAIKDTGMAVARMAGTAQANRELIMFLDDDDELIDGGVQQLRAALDAQPAWCAVVGQIIKFGTFGTRPLQEYKDGQTLLGVGRLLSGPPTTPGAGVIRRSVFDRIPGFVQGISPADDWNMWLHLASSGLVMGLPIDTLRYRIHDQNASRNASVLVRSALDVYAAFRRAEQNATFRMARRNGILQVRGWYKPRLKAELQENLRGRRVASALRVVAVSWRLQAYVFREKVLCKAHLLLSKKSPA